MKRFADLCFLCLVVMTSCGRTSNSAKNTSPPKQTRIFSQKVQVHQVRTENFPLQIVSNGILHAEKKAVLQFRASGIIKSINIQNGVKVKTGQLLATLENQAKKMALQRADNRIEAAKIEFNSLLLGFSSGKKDTSELSPGLLQSLKIQSGLKAAQLNKKQARLALENTYLYAPFSGIIAGLDRQQFDFISSGDIFCKLLDNRHFNVTFSVTEAEIASVYKGEKVLVEPFAYETLQYEGYISQINPVVNDNGLIEISASISPEDYKTNKKNKANRSFPLMDGMHVKVFIEDNVPDQLVIPKQAVVLRDNKKVVFTYVNGLAKWHYIKTGFENSTSYTVIKGLHSGDTIITEGNLNLANNATVEITKH